MCMYSLNFLLHSMHIKLFFITYRESVKRFNLINVIKNVLVKLVNKRCEIHLLGQYSCLS